jgi:hypothetical protein
MYCILILSNLSPMGTASGYIVIQDLYIIPALAMEALENSLWFSLAMCKFIFLLSNFGFPLQVLSLQTLIIRLPLQKNSLPLGGPKLARYPS